MEARKKTDAETQLIAAQAEKTRAEVALVKAETEKTEAETKMLIQRFEQIALVPSGKTTIQVEEENEQIALVNKADALATSKQIAECSGKIRVAASKSGISFGGKKI